MLEWIKTEDRLPEIGTMVLGRWDIPGCENQFETVEYGGPAGDPAYQWIYANDGDSPDHPPTHWAEFNRK